MNFIKHVIWVVFCVFFYTVSAQDKFKFGNCPQKLLEITSYDKDSDAPAFVVYEKENSYYNVNPSSENIEIVTERIVRIKILRTKQIPYASIFRKIIVWKANCNR